MDGLPTLDLWDVLIEVLRSTNNTKTPIRLAPGNWCGTGNRSSNKNQDQNTNLPLSLETETEKGANEMSINCQMWTAYPQTHILLKASLRCTSLKITKL